MENNLLNNEALVNEIASIITNARNNVAKQVNNELLSKLLNLEIYIKELIKVLIERIEITKDKEVIIFLNFKLLQNK